MYNDSTDVLMGDWCFFPCNTTRSKSVEMVLRVY